MTLLRRLGLFIVAFIVTFVILSFSVFSHGENIGETTGNTIKELVQVEARSLYKKVPDIEVQLTADRSVQLSELWKEKPLLITFFYKECAGSCRPFLRSVKESLDKNQEFQDSYNIVSISFDPNDRVDDVQQLAEEIGLSERQNWFTGISSPQDIKLLTEAVGFGFEEFPESNQFDHSSMVTAVRDGKIVRIVFGNIIDSKRIRNLLLELKGFFVPIYSNPDEKVLMRCLDVDMATGAVSFSWGMLVLFVPGGMAVGLVFWIFRVNNFASERFRIKGL